MQLYANNYMNVFVPWYNDDNWCICCRDINMYICKEVNNCLAKFYWFVDCAHVFKFFSNKLWLCGQSGYEDEKV